MSGTETAGLIIAGLVMLAGLIGTLVPGVPGAPLILAAAIGHKIYFGPESIGYFGIALLVLLTILSMVLDFLGSLFGAKKMGATWRGMLGAIVGAIVGIFFSLPGLILGPIIGAFLFELISGRAWKESARAGAGAFIGMILGAVGRVVCCVLMIVVFSTGVIWNHSSAALAGSASTNLARSGGSDAADTALSAR
jgi:hypothetical protein